MTIATRLFTQQCHDRFDSFGRALVKRRDDRGEKRFVAKGHAHARADDDLIGHRLGHAVIQLATDRAVDDDSDEGGHAEI